MNIFQFKFKKKKKKFFFPSDACLKGSLPRRTHLTQVELVQTLVDPLLHVQPLLQLPSVVLDGNAGVSLREMAGVIRRKVRI